MRCSTPSRSTSSTVSRTCGLPAVGTAVESSLAGELIASEAEVNGKVDTFADVPRIIAERRRDSALVEPIGVALGATGSHPWANWKDGSSIRRTTGATTSSSATSSGRTTPWLPRSRRDQGRRPRAPGDDRASQLAARAPGSVCQLAVRRERQHGSPFGAHADLHAVLPTLWCPDAFHSWADYESYVRFLYDTGSVTEHTQLWWSVRPHLAFPTVEIRICDGQPDLGASQSLAALCVALTARIARAIDEGEAIVDQPHRLIEENMWRAIRYGLSGELIDLERGEVLPARARIERLIEWVLPGRERDRRRRLAGCRSRTRLSARSSATPKATNWRRSTATS